MGLLKDECSGQIVTEFVGLRSKMYSIRVNGQDFVKKAKGIRAGIVDKTIGFDDYVECLNFIATFFENLLYKVNIWVLDFEKFLFIEAASDQLILVVLEFVRYRIG